jgi:DNA-binding transcriptional MerR regulator/mannose-6-phosphate isomerase-like protein (cupin superfamily)
MTPGSKAVARGRTDRESSTKDRSAEHEPVDGVYIQQAAAMVGATSAALRMWEKYGIVRPSRTTSGYRVYTMTDIERMRQVRELLEDGVNLAGILRILESNGQTLPRSSKRQGEARVHRTVGGTIRGLRAQHNLTLRQVSERTGLSPSYISSVERSLASPSIASLQKLATAFDTNVLTLLSDSYEAPDTPVIRRNERRVLQSAHGVTIEDLSTAHSDLEPLVFTIQPGSGSDGPLSHAGEEFLYVLEGRLRLRLDGVDDYDLDPGDAMSYDSLRAHQFSNIGTEPTVVVWINTPRTF